MLFPSLVFLFLFLPVVLACYYLLRGYRKLQNRFLLVSSLLFYAYGEPKFVFVMIAVVAADWLFALAIQRLKGRPLRTKALLAIAVASNVVVLFVAKYMSLSVGIVNALFGAGLNDPAFPLPIGVSFFTFQSLSYVIDVYRGEPAQRNVLNLGLYVSLFPQLVAGPIVRYTTFEPQLLGRTETLEKFALGVRRFVVGLSKKVLLANPLGLVADHAFDGVNQASCLLLWVGIVAYTLQIYYDFSGYSDMAIGLGRMFGFEFPENFEHPYASRSVSEFWRRWHISLGSWFRDYVYFPLGGSRVASKWRLALNLLVVWSLTGIWHGASLTFLAWGLMYFALIAGEKLIPRYRSFLEGSRVCGRVLTMAFVMVGWVLFRSVGFAEAGQYFLGLVGVGRVLTDAQTLVLLKENLAFLVVGGVLSMPVAARLTGGDVLRTVSPRVAFVIGWLSIAGLAILFALDVAWIVKGFYNPFIYFNF